MQNNQRSHLEQHPIIQPMEKCIFVHNIINKKDMKFATKAIHAGVHPDETTGTIMTPIYQTSTYVQEAPGVNNNNVAVS